MTKANHRSIEVDGRRINWQAIDEKDYFSLSDMAQQDGGIERIRNWMRNRDTIEFLATWEQIHNPDFNVVQMHHITEDVGMNRFIMSPQKWCDETNAIGLISKRGRYGGVYAHKDIAYHFGMWLSPRFSLLMITEFDRLKAEESSRQQLESRYTGIASSPRSTTVCTQTRSKTTWYPNFRPPKPENGSSMPRKQICSMWPFLA